MNLNNLIRSQGLISGTVCLALAIVLIAGLGFDYEKSCDQSLPSTCNWPDNSSVSTGQLYFEPLSFLPNRIDVNVNQDFCSNLACVEAAAFYLPCHSIGLSKDSLSGMAIENPSIEPHCAATGCNEDQCLEIAYGCYGGAPKTDESATFSCKPIVFKRNLLVIPIIVGIVMAIVGSSVLLLTITQVVKKGSKENMKLLEINKRIEDNISESSYSQIDYDQHVDHVSDSMMARRAKIMGSSTNQAIPEIYQTQTQRVDNSYKHYGNSSTNSTSHGRGAEHGELTNEKSEVPVLIVTTPPDKEV